MIADKTPITILAKYSDFVYVFSKKFAIVLLEHIKINTYVIDLEEDKQPLYKPIYSLKPVALKTPKTYIKTKLAHDFICLSKLPAGAPILFDKKPN